MKFTLTMLPDGHAILTTPDDLDMDTAQRITAAWDQWKATDEAMIVVNNCTVQHATSVEIELPV